MRYIQYKACEKLTLSNDKEKNVCHKQSQRGRDRQNTDRQTKIQKHTRTHAHTHAEGERERGWEGREMKDREVKYESRPSVAQVSNRSFSNPHDILERNGNLGTNRFLPQTYRSNSGHQQLVFNNPFTVTSQYRPEINTVSITLSQSPFTPASGVLCMERLEIREQYEINCQDDFDSVQHLKGGFKWPIF